jgi:GT2 family glycosyltransferase
MNVIIAHSLNNAYVQECIDTFYKTAPDINCNLHVIREQATREDTLNLGMEIVGIDDDILFTADDIEFTNGWYQALKQYYNMGEIIGFSMLYPKTDTIQDRGYDLVKVDSRVVLEPKDRGMREEEVKPFGFREVDSLCGCFMLVKKNVFRYVKKFREEGCNRWGEFIFISEARKNGSVKTIVLDHLLYHHGISTKVNQNVKFSSNSYRYEKPLWVNVVDKFIDQSWIRDHKLTTFGEKDILEITKHNRNILIYGIGTVAESLLNHILGYENNIQFATGLDEETGTTFGHKKVLNINDIDVNEFDLIVITPLNVGMDILRKHFTDRIDKNSSGQIAIVKEVSTRTNKQFNLSKVDVSKLNEKE